MRQWNRSAAYPTAAPLPLLMLRLLFEYVIWLLSIVDGWPQTENLSKHLPSSYHLLPPYFSLSSFLLLNFYYGGTTMLFNLVTSVQLWTHSVVSPCQCQFAPICLTPWIEFVVHFGQLKLAEAHSAAVQPCLHVDVLIWLHCVHWLALYHKSSTFYCLILKLFSLTSGMALLGSQRYNWEHF